MIESRLRQTQNFTKKMGFQCKTGIIKLFTEVEVVGGGYF